MDSLLSKMEYMDLKGVARDERAGARGVVADYLDFIRPRSADDFLEDQPEAGGQRIGVAASQRAQTAILQRSAEGFLRCRS